MFGEMDHFWSENDASEYAWKLQSFMFFPKKLSCEINGLFWFRKWHILITLGIMLQKTIFL